MLSSESLIAFVATADSEKSKLFYRDVLGLRLVSDEPFAIVFDANGTQLRIQKTNDVKPPPYTSLGWQVRDIRAELARLAQHGVQPERFPQLQQDEAGIWTTPSSAQIAWFKDPSGHVLSLTQF
jgi:catechol 2,3-dioxygenase-like lactoylglutathione lyase family enzyme